MQHVTFCNCTMLTVRRMSIQSIDPYHTHPHLLAPARAPRVTTGSVAATSVRCGQSVFGTMRSAARPAARTFRMKRFPCRNVSPFGRTGANRAPGAPKRYAFALQHRSPGPTSREMPDAFEGRTASARRQPPARRRGGPPLRKSALRRQRRDAGRSECQQYRPIATATSWSCRGSSAGARRADFRWPARGTGRVRPRPASAPIATPVRRSRGSARTGPSAEPAPDS